jgi:HK97 family phage prohead protease
MSKKFLFHTGKKAPSLNPVTIAVGDELLVGRSVKTAEGFMGRVVSVSGGRAKINIAIPYDGEIVMTDSTEYVVAKDCDILDSPLPTLIEKIRSFETGVPFTQGSLKATAVYQDEEEKIIMDYKDVVFEGLASTFEDYTPRDRIGDYIISTAFDKTIPRFKLNPVMLVDHKNSAHCVAGSYSKIGKSKIGLAVTGVVSNAPDMRSIRFKIAEGHLKAMSIGGLFKYMEDGMGIEEVELFEISVVAIPMNPDSLLTSVRSLDIDTVKKIMYRT